MTHETSQDQLLAGGRSDFSSWFSEAFSHVAVEYLASGSDYLLVLAEDLRVLEVNEAFARDVASPAEIADLYFTDTLTDSSSHEISRLASEDQLDARKVEIMHLVKGGTRSVEYFLRRSENMWVAIGRDLTVQMELVSQMAALVNELEVKVDHAKERSKSLKKLSELDPLTGLCNRRGFQCLLDVYMRQYEEKGIHVSLIHIDIDGFKQVNDLHGHLVGDQILTGIAQVLQSGTRDSDCVARMGGDEFVVLAPGAALEPAVDLAERLRRAVRNLQLPGMKERISISLGVASTSSCAFPGEVAAFKSFVGGSPKVLKECPLQPGEGELLQLSDKALYVAKHAGRDQVSFAG